MKIKDLVKAGGLSVVMMTSACGTNKDEDILHAECREKSHPGYGADVASIEDCKMRLTNQIVKMYEKHGEVAFRQAENDILSHFVPLHDDLLKIIDMSNQIEQLNNLAMQDGILSQKERADLKEIRDLFQNHVEGTQQNMAFALMKYSALENASADIAKLER